MEKFRVMFIQAAELNHDSLPIYSQKAWFDDLTVAYMSALTPTDVEFIPVVEKFDRVDFNAKVDLVAISAMGVSPMKRAYEISRQFRERNIPVVFGGSNFSLNWKEASDHCDSVILGHAENNWRRVLDDAKKGKLKQIYEADPLADLSNLPTPHYHIFNQQYSKIGNHRFLFHHFRI